MIRHMFRIAAITLVAALCMFYPFLPGRHDRLAVTLSMMAQLLGLAGLLLVPIGAAWLIYELVKRRAHRPGLLEFGSRTDKGHSLMVHDQDLLEATQDEIDAERRYHVVHHAHVVPPPAPPHWKFFWFD